MDAVKRKVEEINGGIDISSTQGRGTEITLKFPLTMATLKVGLFKIEAGYYAIPSFEIEQIVAISEADPNTHVRFDNDSALFNRNGTIIPLIEPRDFLQSLSDDTSLKERVKSGQRGSVIVFKVDQAKWGLCVSEVSAFIDIVIKPLDIAMNPARVFSGAAVLGNGDLALVLNLKKIVEMSDAWRILEQP